MKIAGKCIDLWIGVAIFGLLATAGAESIPAAAAGAHVGKEVTVAGRVVRVAKLEQSTGRPTILDLDRAFPNASLQVVIFEKDLTAFSGDLRATYVGKTVEVTGTIIKFRNTPQIVVAGPNQLRLEGAAAEPPGLVVAAEAPTAANEDDETIPDAGDGFEDTVAPAGAVASAVFGGANDGSTLQPNLLKNGDFSVGKSAWTVERGTEVAQIDGGPALRIRLSPDGVVRVTQKITSDIPEDARQYQAFFQARLDPAARLDKPLTLYLGEKPGSGSKLARRVQPGGAWREVKWTRTADLKGHSPLIFTIEAGPGEGDLWIRGVILFAHPDYKDKATWKVSDG
jgi:hypothetical protein